MSYRTALPLAALLLLSSAAFAERKDDGLTAGSSSSSSSSARTIEEKYRNCMEADCALPDQIQLMDEMTAELRKTLSLIDLECRKAGYAACISPGHESARQWHDLHDHMASLMQRMEEKGARTLSQSMPDPEAPPPTDEWLMRAAKDKK